MKAKFILLLLLVFTWASSNAQQYQTKTEKIFENKTYSQKISAMYSIVNGERDTTIIFAAKNHRYSYLNDVVTIYHGTPQDFYDFLCEVSDFFDREKPNVNEDEYIRELIKNHFVHIVKMYGFYGIHVYQNVEDGDGYHGFRPKQFKKIIPIFEEWCKKKGINIEKKTQQ